MRYLIALLLPWISFFTMGKIFQGILCLILQCTGVGWPIATIWALIAVAGYNADKRTDRVVQAINSNSQAAVDPRRL
jgi:hypothetical protein